MPITEPFAKALHGRAGIGSRFFVVVVLLGAVLGSSAASRAAQPVVDEDDPDPDPGVVWHPTREQRDRFSRKGLAKRATPEETGEKIAEIAMNQYRKGFYEVGDDLRGRTLWLDRIERVPARQPISLSAQASGTCIVTVTIGNRRFRTAFAAMPPAP